jgi:hypothetical protein
VLVVFVAGQSDAGDVLGKIRAQWRLHALQDRCHSAHACIHLHERLLGDTAGSVYLICASSFSTHIITASSYPQNVTDYRFPSRQPAIASLASLFGTCRSSDLYARRHICSNPLELLKSHLYIHRYWTPCVCSSACARLASFTKSPRSRL